MLRETHDDCYLTVVDCDEVIMKSCLDCHKNDDDVDEEICCCQDLNVVESLNLQRLKLFEVQNGADECLKRTLAFAQKRVNQLGNKVAGGEVINLDGDHGDDDDDDQKMIKWP